MSISRPFMDMIVYTCDVCNVTKCNTQDCVEATAREAAKLEGWEIFFDRKADGGNGQWVEQCAVCRYGEAV